MIIDFHAHVGDFRYRWDDTYRPMTWDDLIARLDEEGVDKAVFLPVYNASPENAPVGMLCGEKMAVADQIIAAASRADRIIPFTNVDPRNEKSIGLALDWAKEHGCRGVGEIMTKLPFDDPRVIDLFRKVGERQMLVTIESSSMLPGGAGLCDDPESPRLERLLAEAPETIIIGHGQGFWSEIGPVNSPEEKMGYPLNKPIPKEGSLARLFRQHNNLFADLSAKSCFCALTRDVDYGVSFLNEFQDRLLFGTDLISFNDQESREKQKKLCSVLIEQLLSDKRVDIDTWNKIQWHHGYMPQLDYLRALQSESLISPDAFRKITGENGLLLLKAAGGKNV